MATIIIVGCVAFLVILTIIGLMSRYRRCPSNKMLIVFGSTGKDKEGNKTPSKIIHGGGCFVWPIIQDYDYISTLPIQIKTVANDILSSQNINVSFPVNLTVSIDTSSEEHKQAAAAHLLGLEDQNLKDLLTNNLLGGLRAVVATLTIEELNRDRDKFLQEAAKAIEPSLRELGLKIIDLNMEDLSDKDHYLENLSKKAVTKAESEAKADIAEMKKTGDIREAEANKQKEVTVSQHKQEQAIQLAEIERVKQERTAAIAKEQAIAIAQQKSEERANVAKANTEAAKAEAVANAEASFKTAEANADAKAKIAQANAKSEAEQAEADADKNTRVAQAQAVLETEKSKAEQEKDARIAEFEADKRKRQAVADQEAKVTAQKALAEIAKAEGQAEKTKQEAQQLAGVAKVEAEMLVAKQKQERQLEVNNAEAKAKEARLYADKIVPAQADKQALEIKAEQEKSIKLIQAEAQAEAQKRVADGEAYAIQQAALAESEAVKLKGQAEAAAVKAKLNAQYDAEVEKAVGLSKAEVAGILQLSEKLGDPQAAIQFFMRDVTRDTEIAKAYAGSLHEIMGNVTVYGDASTASSFANNMLGMLPNIKQIGKALGETVKVAKEAFNTKPEEKNPSDISDLGEQQFEDVH